jgi:adenylylsulfate kinase
MPDNDETGSRRASGPIAGPGGLTVWLTGLPSASKSTITRDLGFSKEDRNENVRRIGWSACLLARNGVAVLVPVIAPYESARREVGRRHRDAGVPYLGVHGTTAVRVCAPRDVKGLYASQARGELTGLTGVDDPYEAPVDPDLRVDTEGRSVAESAARVHGLPADRGVA